MSTAAMIERLIEAAVDYERASGIYAAGARRELSEARAAIEAALSPPEPTEGLRATLLNIQAMAERGFRIDNAKLSEQCKHALRAMPLQDHGWQPINTAPKDGSVIQLFVPDDDDGDVVWPAHWTLPAAKNHLGAWKHCAAGRWVAEDSDQRWRPLAAPPMLAEEGTKS